MGNVSLAPLLTRTGYDVEMWILIGSSRKDTKDRQWHYWKMLFQIKRKTIIVERNCCTGMDSEWILSSDKRTNGPRKKFHDMEI